MRAGSGRRVVARSEAAEAPQLAGMAGDDPLTPRRCEPVPAVAWSLDREQPRRRSSSGMAGDDPLTPRRCEPVPAVAWSLDPKRPRRRSSQAWPVMIHSHPADASRFRPSRGRLIGSSRDAAARRAWPVMIHSHPADASRFRPSRGRSIGSSRDAAARRHGR